MILQTIFLALAIGFIPGWLYKAGFFVIIMVGAMFTLAVSVFLHDASWREGGIVMGVYWTVMPIGFLIGVFARTLQRDYLSRRDGR